MTHVIKAKNVNHAFKDAWWWLRVAGLREQSRNGPVLVAPGPVVTEYTRPWERVLFSPKRDANPVFHLMEAIWMMAGSEEVEWLSQFSSNIKNYAQDSGILWGAYGYRWRNEFEVDQITEIVEVLKANPDSRQAVLQMWSADLDLIADETGFEPVKDRPCNTNIYFDLRGGSLNMTVCCRSNDMLWGAYGANAVHMSFLQELLASELKLSCGVYRQFSNNFHVYTDLPMVRSFLEDPPYEAYDWYQDKVGYIPLLSVYEHLGDFLGDCEMFIRDGSDMQTHFMKNVAVPLRDAYYARKDGKKIDWSTCYSCDWKTAFMGWCERRDK